MRDYLAWKAGFALLTFTFLFFVCLMLMPGEVGAIERSDTVQDDSSRQPIVYFTFDDGPSKLTPKVLDILKEHDVKATFFVLGEQAEAREDTVRRVAAEGHALGNHTFDHKYRKLYNSFEQFFSQVKATDEVLKRITGKSVRLLRALLTKSTFII